MNNSRPEQAQLSIAIGVIGLSLLILIMVSMSSFRLGFSSLEFAWQVNFSRIASAATGGLAFATLGGLIDNRRNELIQIFGFSIVSIVSSIFLMGAILDWPKLIVAGLAFLGAWGMFLFSKLTLEEHSKQNLVLSLLLGVSLVLSMLNFVGASGVGEVTGSILLWFQGDLNVVGVDGSWTLPLAALLVAWLLFTSAKEIPACLLLGLGLGVTGPIFFISLLVPTLIRTTTKLNSGRLFLLSCGISGAMFVVLGDTFSRILVGGYAPTLIIPIALVSIPIILWRNRLRVLAIYPSAKRGTVEASLILVWVALTIFVFYHIVEFANLLT